MCAACTTIHDSCCAVHNAPSTPNGPCDCSVSMTVSPSPASDAASEAAFATWWTTRTPAADRAPCTFMDLNSARAAFFAARAASTRTASDTRTVAGGAVEPCDLVVAKVRVVGDGVGFQDARLSILKRLDGKPLYAKASDLLGIWGASADFAGGAECDAARRAAPAGQHTDPENVIAAVADLVGTCAFDEVCALDLVNAFRKALGIEQLQLEVEGLKWACKQKDADAEVLAAGPACQGGNTQPEPASYAYGPGKSWVVLKNPMSPRDFAAARPAEVDVEVERRAAVTAYQSISVGADDGTGFAGFFNGWLAARTQADAGQAGAATQIAEGP